VSRLLTLFSLLLLLPLGAYAQGGNVFIGYSYLNADGADRTNFNGWNGSLEGKFLPFVGVVADLSGYYGKEDLGFTCLNPCTTPTARQYNFVFGPRVSVSVGKFTPFAHYLVGASHISFNDNFGSDTSFSQAVGGGLDFKPVPIIGWRFQGDFLQTRFFSNTQNNFRFSTGIVLHF
jgi:hypothetical protein